MGGGSSSESKTKVHTQNVVEQFAQSILNCSSKAQISQSVTIRGNYNVVKGVRLVQGLKLAFTCKQDETTETKMQQDIASSIKNNSAAQSDAVFGALGKSNSKTETEIFNEVRQTVTNQTVKDIISSFNATQDFFLDGNSNIVQDVTMEQSMQVLYDNCFAALSKVDSFQQMVQTSETSSTASQTNFVSQIVDSVGSILTGLGSMWMMIVLVALAVGAYVVVQGGGLGAILGSPAVQGMMPPGKRMGPGMMPRPMGPVMPGMQPIGNMQQRPPGMPPLMR